VTLPLEEHPLLTPDVFKKGGPVLEDIPIYVIKSHPHEVIGAVGALEVRLYTYESTQFKPYLLVTAITDFNIVLHRFNFDTREESQAKALVLMDELVVTMPAIDKTRH